MTLTLILSFFRSLSLDHLEKCIYSLSKQTVLPENLLFFDNNSIYCQSEIESEIHKHFALSDWRRVFCKHSNPNRTLSWAGNRSIEMCDTEVFIHTRCDFLYAYDWCEKMLAQYEPMSFVGCAMFQMNYHEGVERSSYGNIDLESFDWRSDPRNLLKNTEGSRTERNCHIDSPSFVTDKSAFKASGGYDETLVRWGHPQQDFQIQMARNGVQIKVIPEVLCYHMDHGPMEGDSRDRELAMQEWCKSPRRSPEEAQWMEQNLKVSTE